MVQIMEGLALRHRFLTVHLVALQLRLHLHPLLDKIPRLLENLHQGYPLHYHNRKYQMARAGRAELPFPLHPHRHQHLLPNPQGFLLHRHSYHHLWQLLFLKAMY